ncbi:membrane protein [Fusobacterium nucleatum YWH7199]|uniref:Putative membrane protein n=1 Tax=Fusobacterium nucleatum TaxID=851 RepID=A0A133NQX6_FUSNU|nr:DMT family transporter [Fusobacterium nucleatum]KXA18692.1 putative membrane protein [Fusobacterium nucleatum]MCL4575984.1 membrane protein [Fusobacterium nucleatum YWH7056]MCL4580854.1 membrane protein [Fusobacterium nucleatum YWH7199]MCL4582724.1 membrane protein [Fusobacterium nucleatum YWH7054]MCL4592252.1 membrane protein [Fusobacterium nucleatum YWH7053]
MQENHKYNICMFIATIFFGMTYVLTKICLNYSTELHIISFRFLIAFVISLIFLQRKIFPLKIKEILYSLILSVLLFMVFITMTIGVKYTTATNASFLISLSVIFIPFFSWIFNKEKPKKSIFIVLIIALIGIMLLTLDKNLEFHIGDILCLICSLLFSFHVLITERFVKNNNPITLGVLQFGGVAILSFLVQYPIEKFTLPKNEKFWISLMILSVFCTALAYIIQTVSQKKLSSTLIGLILSLEPIFSGIFGYFILKEYLNFQQYIGAFLLLISVIYVTVKN